MRNQVAWMAVLAAGMAVCAFPTGRGIPDGCILTAEAAEEGQEDSWKISPDGKSWELTLDRVFTEVSDGKIPETLVLPPEEGAPDSPGGGSTDSEDSGQADGGSPGSRGGGRAGGAEIRLRLRSAEVLREYWKEDVEISLTLHRYGADSYTFGGVSIPAGAAEPDPAGLLPAAGKAVGADPETLRLLTCSWAGEPYRDDEGVRCRDARILGERKLTDIRGVYSGNMRREKAEVETAAVPESVEAEEEASAEETAENAGLSRGETEREMAAGPATAAGLAPSEEMTQDPPARRGFLDMAVSLVRRLLESRTVRVSLFVLFLAAAGTVVFLRCGRKLGRAWHRDRK